MNVPCTIYTEYTHGVHDAREHHFGCRLDHTSSSGCILLQNIKFNSKLRIFIFMSWENFQAAKRNACCSCLVIAYTVRICNTLYVYWICVYGIFFVYENQFDSVRVGIPSTRMVSESGGSCLENWFLPQERWTCLGPLKTQCPCSIVTSAFDKFLLPKCYNKCSAKSFKQPILR